jgi:hypothetical protein
MSQNTSSAVMQQRSEPHDSLDDFPTPPWATRALCDWMVDWVPYDTFDVCREPAANRGHMVKPLSEYFTKVVATDIHDYGAGYPVRDYLFGPMPSLTNWTITNPPFRLAEEFIARALASSSDGVAVIVRSAFLESVGRWRNLFSVNPPTDILQFSERVVMHKGKLSEKGSTATAYCWLVWRISSDAMHEGETRFHWIPPCRKRLERAGDYL